MQGADANASKGGAGGGQLNQFRERIVTELKMDAEQQQRLDPIFAEMRNKFMGLRDLPEEARARQGAAIRSDMRARVEEILKPEQKARYAEIVTELAGRAGGGQSDTWPHLPDWIAASRKGPRSGSVCRMER